MPSKVAACPTIFDPFELTPVASPGVVVPVKRSKLGVQRTARRIPCVGCSKNPTMVEPSAEIALARLLAPLGWLSPTIPRPSLHRNPCAPGQYHDSPTTTEPSRFTP